MRLIRVRAINLLRNFLLARKHAEMLHKRMGQNKNLTLRKNLQAAQTGEDKSPLIVKVAKVAIS